VTKSKVQAGAVTGLFPISLFDAQFIIFQPLKEPKLVRIIEIRYKNARKSRIIEPIEENVDIFD
jgi:hypothetical protein